jgi:hypothetical protein
VAASTPFARSYFRQAWANAQAEGVTLLAKLTALNASTVEATATGQVIQATSGNGRSVTFAGGGGNTKFPSEGATPNDIVELLDRLLNLYDAAVADGANTDALRYSWILDALQPVRVIRSNFALQIHR